MGHSEKGDIVNSPCAEMNQVHLSIFFYRTLCISIRKGIHGLTSTFKRTYPILKTFTKYYKIFKEMINCQKSHTQYPWVYYMYKIRGITYDIATRYIYKLWVLILGWIFLRGKSRKKTI